MKIKLFTSVGASCLFAMLFVGMDISPASAASGSKSKTIISSKDSVAKVSGRTPSKSASKVVASAKSTKSKATSKVVAKKSVAKPDLYAALVVNADTGEVLYEKSAGESRYPASLTKMMTLYLTFDALKHGVLDVNKSIAVSSKAAGQPQTNISLHSGDRLSIKTAIESLVVRSANDSAMALGESIGGTEFNFALAMTQKARELGMKNTVFRNPNGLPDDKQVTTAYDMARLAIALRRDFPEYYHYFKLTSFAHNGITYPGHNRVMEKYAGADGVKTGYIRASGFNLVTSVSRAGHRLVAVVFGGTSSTTRDSKMIALLDQTFAQLASKANDKDGNVAHSKPVPGDGASSMEAVETLQAHSIIENGQGDCSGAACR